MSITTNEILIPKKLFGAKVDKELELDAPLPDYCPDIARLVKVDCTPFAESCDINEDKATVSGRAVFDILYETDYKNRLTCCSFTQDFSVSTAIPRSNATDITAFCDVNCERISCKLLGPRRFIIKSTLGADFAIEGELSVKAVAVNEDKNIFFRKKTIGFEGRTAQYTEEYKFGEMLALNQSEKCIGEIVCGSITLQTPQITVSPGRAEIKSTAFIHALCEEEDNEGKYYMTVKTLPINIDYSNEAIEDYKHVSVSLIPTSSTLTPELDQYGESRMIKTDFAVKLELKLNEPKAVTVAEDLFEKDYDSDIVKDIALLPQLYSQTDTNFSVESKLSEMTPRPETILDSSAKDYGSAVEKTDGGVNVSGNFILTLIANTAEGIYSFDHSVPYNQFFSLEIPESESSVVADTYPIEVLTTLHTDGSVTARIIAGTKLYVYNEKEEAFVSEIDKRTARQDDEGAALVYCFPQKGEDLWSIAKLYRADPEAIAVANPKAFEENGHPRELSKPILIKR